MAVKKTQRSNATRQAILLLAGAIFLVAAVLLISGRWLLAWFTSVLAFMVAGFSVDKEEMEED